MKTLNLTLVLIIATCFFYFSYGTTSEASENKTNNLLGTVKVIEKGNIKIHSYMSPANGLFANTQIIESANKLVVVDVQFLRAHAKDVKDYIDTLKKPIDRIIVSHFHPDHWFGLELFKNIPIYALPQVTAKIEKVGDIIIEKKRKRLKELVTSQKVVPNFAITKRKATIDGVLYKFEKIENAEADVQLLIKIPEVNTLIMQDLIYNGVHAFVGNNTVENWITVLNGINKLSNYDTILPGHGKASGKEIISDMVNYLKNAKSAMKQAKTGEELKKQLVAKYPEYNSPVLLDISNKYLFNK